MASSGIILLLCDFSNGSIIAYGQHQLVQLLKRVIVLADEIITEVASQLAQLFEDIKKENKSLSKKVCSIIVFEIFD